MNLGNKTRNEVIGLLVIHENDEHLPEHLKNYGRITGQYRSLDNFWCNVHWTFPNGQIMHLDFPQNQLIQVGDPKLPTVEELLG